MPGLIARIPAGVIVLSNRHGFSSRAHPIENKRGDPEAATLGLW